MMASTAQLVRSVRDGRQPGEVRDLMSVRRRLLRDLVAQEHAPVNLATLESLEQAVAESDRTLEDLLGAPGN
ncbi:MAG: hypothetical protein QM696_06675 [Steroidobacteraceae bacterium]